MGKAGGGSARSQKPSSYCTILHGCVVAEIKEVYGGPV